MGPLCCQRITLDKHKLGLGSHKSSLSLTLVNKLELPQIMDGPISTILSTITTTTSSIYLSIYIYIFTYIYI